jgi:hypothetical protein
MEISIEVNDDGTGTASFLSAVNTETMSMLGGEDELGGGFFEDVDQSDLPPGATLEPYDQDGFQGQRLTVPFTHNGDVAAALAAAEGEAVPIGSADDPFQTFELRRDGDMWVFNAAMNVGEEMGEDVGNPAEDEMMRGFFEDASFTIRIKLPGGVTEHNADRVAGDGALIWDLDVLSAETREMTATSDPSRASSGGDGGGLGTPVIIGIIVAVVAVAAVVAYLMMKRRPAGTPPPASA